MLAFMVSVIAAAAAAALFLFRKEPTGLLGYRVPPYRPERHYMRGRGPKWHAKHGDMERG
jgi:hypothetical protein